MKRFIESELFERPDFVSARSKIKILTIFLFTKCDCIGIFRMAIPLINVYLGEQITEKDVLSVPIKIEKLKDGVFWLVDFCQFQYGELTETCRPHLKYIKLLKENDLFLRVSKGYPKGIHTLQEQEQEEDKEKEEEKEKDKRVKIRKFIPPTLLEVQSYITEKGYGLDAKVFFEFFDASGWVDGKGNKVRNWKQKVITWNSRNTPKPETRIRGLR